MAAAFTTKAKTKPGAAAAAAALPSPEGMVCDDGQMVWFRHDAEHMWLPCTVTRGCQSKFEEVELAPEVSSLGAAAAPPPPFTTPTTMLLHMHPSSKEAVRDMVRLGDLNEASILHNLRLRFSLDLIYTLIGPILVSVNPYTRLPIYAEVDIVRYNRAASADALESLEPHIFGVTAQAYRQLRTTATNQSMVISGESGAGKTEATKCAVRFLAAVGGQGAGSRGPEQLLLDSSPIMEAFGNAKTVRNNNSSRFGKYMEIQFDRHGVIRGGKVTKYLLEKSRIVGQAKGERNFHMFFMLFKLDLTTRLPLWLAEDGDGDSWKMRASSSKHGEQPESVGNFHYLSGGSAIDGWNDASELADIQRAMVTIGMSAPHQLGVWQAVGAVLWLGNIGFDEVEDEQGGTRRSAVQEKDLGELALERSASLLQVNEEALATSLTTRKMKSRDGVIVIPLDAERACDARDGLAKCVYSTLFDWLIVRIDDAMRTTEGDRSLGVLDIFGFEIFEINSFEQLCINLANEKLQYHFNNHVFNLELAVYEEEGLNVSEITFRDNAPCLELIEGSRTGLLALADDELAMPKGSDTGLLRKYTDQHRRHDCYAPGKGLGRKKKGEQVDAAAAAAAELSFVVKHYAGEVKYSTLGFLVKNKDKVEDDLLSLLAISEHPIVSELFSGEDAIGVPKKSGGKTVSQGGQFKRSLGELYATLEATSPHFVKCIKPNNVKKNEFDSKFSLFQLQYLGLLEVIRIRKSGYPVRMPVRRFMGRYAFVAPDALDPAGVVEAVGTAGDWQIGKTMVFVKDSMYQLLEVQRTVVIARLIPSMQSWFKEELTRVAWTKKRRGVALLKAKMCGDRERLEGRAALSCLRAIKARELSQLETAELQTEVLVGPPENLLACFGRPNLLPPLLAEVRSLVLRLEEEEAVVFKLEEGMEKHDAEVLAAAVEDAAALQLKLPLLGRAQRTLSVLRESADVLKKLQEAMRTPKGPDQVGALVGALALAGFRGLDGSEEEALPEVTEAKEMLSMAKLETAVMKRRETEPLGTLGARKLLDAPAEAEVPAQPERRRRRSVDATGAGRQRRRRGSFEAPPETKPPTKTALVDGWTHISPALRELGEGMDRAAMRAAFVQLADAPRPPADSDVYALFRSTRDAKIKHRKQLHDYPRLRSRFGSLYAPSVPLKTSLIAMVVGSAEEEAAVRLAATLPAILHPGTSDSELTQLVTQLLSEGYAGEGELRDELLLQLCVMSNHAVGSGWSGGPLWLARWLCMAEACCRLWRPSPGFELYLTEFVRTQPHLGVADQRAPLLAAIEGSAVPLDPVGIDDLTQVSSWVLETTGKTAQRDAGPVPVLVHGSATEHEVFAAGTRADTVVSQLVTKLKLGAPSLYAVYVDSGEMGAAAVALPSSMALIDGLLAEGGSAGGQLVLRRRLMFTNAMEGANPGDSALIYAMLAAQLASGGLRPLEVGDLVTMMSLRHRIENGSVEGTAMTRVQLEAWLAPSEAARTVWDPAVWIAEIDAVYTSVLANKWSAVTCRRHFVRIAESAPEHGMALFSVCVTATAPGKQEGIENAVVRIGISRTGITVFPLATGGAMSRAVGLLLNGKTHREFSFDSIEEWHISEPPQSALVVVPTPTLFKTIPSLHAIV